VGFGMVSSYPFGNAVGNIDGFGGPKVRFGEKCEIKVHKVAFYLITCLNIPNVTSSEEEPDQSFDAGEEFSRLLMANRNRIFGFIYSLVHDRSAAEDILQNVSAILWKKFDQFELGTDFGAWAMKVSRFKVLQWREKQSKVPLPLGENELFQLADASVVVSFDDGERREALLNCLVSLPGKHREILAARYFSKLSVTQIAEGRNRSRRAIYKMLDRIRAVLLDCILKRMQI